MIRRSSIARVGLSACALITVVGCSSVPGTGRKQLMLVSRGQATKLGADAYREVLSKEKVSKDERMTKILRRVGKRIAKAAEEIDHPDFDWEFNLIESDQVNAFCLPGGKIAVYTAILPVMDNEAGMAVIMGHEVAHAVARHGGERMSQHMGVELIQKGLGAGLQDASPAAREGVMKAFGLGANVGMLLPYSRKHELEADHLGLMYAARAGYDPRESVPLWRRMQALSKKKPPEFLSTHPHEENRIEQLEEYMPTAMEAYDDVKRKHGKGAALFPKARKKDRRGSG